MRKQLTALEKPNQHQPINIADVCPLENRHNNSHSFNVRASSTNLTTQQPSVEYSQDLAKTSLDDLHSDRVDNVFLDIVEEGKDWNYIKIPLTLEEKSPATPKISHWLILAIKPSLLHSDRASDSDSIITKSTVNKLLATISHELKSPLTSILGLSNLLNTQKLGKFNQRQTEYIELIHNSAQKLMTIVNDSIELTNLTTGKFELQPEEIELEALFHKLYQQIIAKFQAIDSVESDLLISPSTALKDTPSDIASLTSQTRLNRKCQAVSFRTMIMTRHCLATSGIKLNIEPGLEIAVADRLRLSSILSHLILEVVQFESASSMAIEVEVKKERGYTAIAIKNGEDIETYPSEDSGGITQDIGLNSIIAKYLAQTLQGDIKSSYNSTGCAFTLLLPTIDSPAKTSSTPVETAANSHDSGKNLTILCLYPETEAIDPRIGDNHNLDFNLKGWAEQDWSGDKQQFTYQHRIIEADGLEQAHTLARIWQLDVIVLDGYQIIDSLEYLRSLQESEHLSTLPIITLDAKTTEAANQVKGLNVYPCLLPAQCRSIQDLMQVIQIATEQ